MTKIVLGIDATTHSEDAVAFARELHEATEAPVSCGRLRHGAADARNGPAPSVSTHVRLTLASVGECGRADIVIRHDC